MPIYKDVSSLETVTYTFANCFTFADGVNLFADGVDFILEKLDAIPEADVEPVKHGHWMPHQTMVRSPFVTNHSCSECGKDSFTYPNCPYCRAKMDEEVE